MYVSGVLGIPLYRRYLLGQPHRRATVLADGNFFLLLFRYWTVQFTNVIIVRRYFRFTGTTTSGHTENWNRTTSTRARIIFSARGTRSLIRFDISILLRRFRWKRGKKKKPSYRIALDRLALPPYEYSTTMLFSYDATFFTDTKCSVGNCSRCGGGGVFWYLSMPKQRLCITFQYAQQWFGYPDGSRNTRQRVCFSYESIGEKIFRERFSLGVKKYWKSRTNRAIYCYSINTIFIGMRITATLALDKLIRICLPCRGLIGLE